MSEMSVIYVEPTPGNGKGHLQKTYNALVDWADSFESAQKPTVKIVGWGYPPLWVGTPGAVEVALKTIEEIVKSVCGEGNFELKRADGKNGPHRDKDGNPSEPQPHVDRSKPAPRPEPTPVVPTPVEPDTKKETAVNIDKLKRKLRFLAEEEMIKVCTRFNIDYEKSLRGGTQTQKVDDLVDRVLKNDLQELQAYVSNL